MVVFPYFSLTANGNDVTEYIRSNLISLTLTDRDGFQSDELTFSVSGIFSRPLLGDVLTLALGVKDNYHTYGTFRVHSTSLNHKSKTTTVRAASVDFSGEIKVRRNKLWESVTLANIVASIAQTHTMKTAVKDADITIKSRLQHNMNDLEFLQKLAEDYGFIFSVKDETLVMLPKGIYDFECEIDLTECLSLNIDRAAKGDFGSVQLHWRDTDAGTDASAIAGQGDPVEHIWNKQPKNYEEGQKMAAAKLIELNGRTVSGSLSLVGGKEILAGGKLILTGAGGDDGGYHMRTVTHNMTTSGYTMSIQFTEVEKKEGR